MVYLKYRRNRNMGDKVLGKALYYNKVGTKLYKNYAPTAIKAYAAYRIAKRLKNIVNAEQKYKDFTISDSNIVYNPTMVCISTMSQGTGSSDRTGISIKAASIYIKSNIYRNATSTTLFDRVRMILLLDKDQDENATLPGTDYILQNTSQPLVINSPIALSRAGRYNILHDKIYTLTDLRPSINVNIYKKLTEHVRFGGSSDATTGLRQGHLYILFISDATANNPGMSTQTRFRYYDN